MICPEPIRVTFSFGSDLFMSVREKIQNSIFSNLRISKYVTHQVSGQRLLKYVLKIKMVS